MAKRKSTSAVKVRKKPLNKKADNRLFTPAEITKARLSKDYDRFNDMYKKLQEEKFTEEELIEYYLENTDHLTKARVTKELERVKVTIANDTMRDFAVHVSTHFRRYDKIFQENKDKLDKELKVNKEPWKNGDLRKRAYNYIDLCVRALHNKEKVLGLHQKKLSVVFNNEHTTSYRKRDPFDHLDFSKLSLGEKIELKKLIEITREGELEIHPFILKDKAIVSDEIEDAVIVEEVNKLEAKKETEVISKLREEKKEGIVSNNKTIEDVGESLKESLMKKIKKTYQEKDKGRDKSKQLAKHIEEIKENKR